MRVVVATAEPFGAYHLASLDRAVFETSGIELVQLLPGPGRPQAPGWVPTVRTPQVLAGADLVLVTGGVATPWTSSVVALAAARRRPAAYVELAWAAPSPVHAGLLVGAAAGSSASSGTVAALTGCAPTVVGRPGVEPVSAPRPDANGVLLLPVVSSEVPDRQARLRRAAERMTMAGWPLRVAPHPREPAGLWDDVGADVSGWAADRQLDGCVAVVGSGTSRMLQAVASGIPVLRIRTGRPAVDDHPLLSRCGPLVFADDVPAAMSAVRPVPVSDRRELVGPSDPSVRLARWIGSLA